MFTINIESLSKTDIVTIPLAINLKTIHIFVTAVVTSVMPGFISEEGCSTISEALTASFNTSVI